MLSIEKVLKDKKVSYRLIELAGEVITHDDVIKNVRDADPEDDCKTIIVKGGKNFYAFFLRGMMKINMEKASNVAGYELKIASLEELKTATGKAPGEICPLLLDIEIFIDQRVFERTKIHFSSGDSRYGLEMNSKDLEKIINFQVVDVAR